MKAEIVAVGSELLLGQIANTNAQYLSEQLNALGIPVYYHSVVGDNPARLQQQLTISSKRSSLIILTGGLGPTKDDLTKETIAQYMNKSLYLDEKAMATIRHFFDKRQVEMTKNNERQAMLIEGCTVFPNEAGLAPGMAVQSEGTHYLLFPGPPYELKPMFEKYAITYLRQHLNLEHIVFSKTMRFCGIGEAKLETVLEDLIEHQSNPTIAPLAKEGEVTIRLTSLAATVTEAEQMMDPIIEEIKNRVGQYLYGWDEETLPNVVVNTLTHNKLTVATAESCTGGLIGHSLTTVSGASRVYKGSIVSYVNDVKAVMLDVPEEVLNNEGAVSEHTARLMAIHVRQKLQSAIGLSVTGVAGPSSQEGKPVGFIYIGIATDEATYVKQLNLSGSRRYIQQLATKLALFEVLKVIQHKD